MKIAKKKIKEIQTRISIIFDLSNLGEDFDVSFETEPACWTDREKALCDYTARIEKEIMLMLGEVLGFSLDEEVKNV